MHRHPSIPVVLDLLFIEIKVSLSIRRRFIYVLKLIAVLHLSFALVEKLLIVRVSTVVVLAVGHMCSIVPGLSVRI